MRFGALCCRAGQGCAIRICFKPPDASWDCYAVILGRAKECIFLRNEELKNPRILKIISLHIDFRISLINWGHSSRSVNIPSSSSAAQEFQCPPSKPWNFETQSESKSLKINAWVVGRWWHFFFGGQFHFALFVQRWTLNMLVSWFLFVGQPHFHRLFFPINDLQWLLN